MNIEQNMGFSFDARAWKKCIAENNGLQAKASLRRCTMQDRVVGCWRIAYVSAVASIKLILHVYAIRGTYVEDAFSLIELENDAATYREFLFHKMHQKLYWMHCSWIWTPHYARINRSDYRQILEPDAIENERNMCRGICTEERKCVGIL